MLRAQVHTVWMIEMGITSDMISWYIDADLYCNFVNAMFWFLLLILRHWTLKKCQVVITVQLHFKNPLEMQVLLKALPVKSATLEVDWRKQQQNTGIVWFLSPKLHAVALCCLKITRLILAVCQFSQPLEGKHTFCWFCGTNTTRKEEGGKQDVSKNGNEAKIKWQRTEMTNNYHAY